MSFERWEKNPCYNHISRIRICKKRFRMDSHFNTTHKKSLNKCYNDKISQFCLKSIDWMNEIWQLWVITFSWISSAGRVLRLHDYCEHLGRVSIGGVRGREVQKKKDFEWHLTIVLYHTTDDFERKKNEHFWASTLIFS